MIAESMNFYNCLGNRFGIIGPFVWRILSIFDLFRLSGGYLAFSLVGNSLPLPSQPIFSLFSCPLKVVSGVTLHLQGSHGFVTFDRSLTVTDHALSLWLHWYSDPSKLPLYNHELKLGASLRTHLLSLWKAGPVLTKWLFTDLICVASWQSEWI